MAVYDGRTLGTTQDKLFGDFFGFAPELRDGFWVAAGDFDGDGLADVALGAGEGGGPAEHLLRRRPGRPDRDAGGGVGHER